jgi:hypothetical protein
LLFSSNRSLSLEIDRWWSTSRLARSRRTRVITAAVRRIDRRIVAYESTTKTAALVWLTKCAIGRRWHVS